LVVRLISILYMIHDLRNDYTENLKFKIGTIGLFQLSSNTSIMLSTSIISVKHNGNKNNNKKIKSYIMNEYYLPNMYSVT